MPSRRLTKAEKAQALDVLKKVRKFLRPNKKPHRWVRYTFGKRVGGPGSPNSLKAARCACVLGAINLVQCRESSDSVTNDPAIIALASVIPLDTVESPISKLIVFNDLVAHDVDDVIDVIDKAIAKLTLRQKEAPIA